MIRVSRLLEAETGSLADLESAMGPLGVSPRKGAGGPLQAGAAPLPSVPSLCPSPSLREQPLTSYLPTQPCLALEPSGHLWDIPTGTCC